MAQRTLSSSSASKWEPDVTQGRTSRGPMLNDGLYSSSLLTHDTLCCLPAASLYSQAQHKVSGSNVLCITKKETAQLFPYTYQAYNLRRDNAITHQQIRPHIFDFLRASL